MLDISGGSITSTLIGNIARLINTFLSIGRTVGTSLRMIISKRKC